MKTIWIVLGVFAILYFVARWCKNMRLYKRLQMVAQTYPMDFRLFVDKEEGWETCSEKPEKPHEWIKLIPNPAVSSDYGYYIKFTGPVDEQTAIKYLISNFYSQIISTSKRKENKEQVPKINSSITHSDSNNTESGLIPISKMEKGDVFPVEFEGQRYWAHMDEQTVDNPVVSLYDNEMAEGDPVPGCAAIDDMTNAMWEAVRVKNF